MMPDILFLLGYATACCGLYDLIACGFLRLVALLRPRVKGDLKSVVFVLLWLVWIGVLAATILFGFSLRYPLHRLGLPLLVVALLAASVPALWHVLKNITNARDRWIELALFPFKTYIATAFFFLMTCFWFKWVFQPRFYGYPENAVRDVSLGYQLCMGALLVGAFVQISACRRWSSVPTLLSLALGLIFWLCLWPRGLTRR